ncbi:MAG: hypothetical protein JXR83_09455 [Deltaproteobacteria bacterium]|nr:hypothetical protein [Deltaproteobacteria bacterium]
MKHQPATSRPCEGDLLDVRQGDQRALQPIPQAAVVGRDIVGELGEHHLALSGEQGRGDGLTVEVHSCRYCSQRVNLGADRLSYRILARLGGNGDG